MRVYTRFSFTVVHLGLVSAHRAIKLGLKRALGIELLLGNYAVFIELLKSLKVEPDIFQRGLVFEERRLRLAQLHFVWPGIDHRQQLACFNFLALLESYL